jgi:hypothetical protein
VNGTSQLEKAGICGTCTLDNLRKRESAGGVDNDDNAPLSNTLGDVLNQNNSMAEAFKQAGGWTKQSGRNSVRQNQTSRDPFVPSSNPFTCICPSSK